eukprot:2484246-Amphidinium_carterae.2
MGGKRSFLTISIELAARQREVHARPCVAVQGRSARVIGCLAERSATFPLTQSHCSSGETNWTAACYAGYTHTLVVTSSAESLIVCCPALTRCKDSNSTKAPTS